MDHRREYGSGGRGRPGCHEIGWLAAEASATDRLWPKAEIQAGTLPHAALRSGGSWFKHRQIHNAVSFSCTPFCARRCASEPKSTWSSGWSWLKQENTWLVLTVCG